MRRDLRNMEMGREGKGGDGKGRTKEMRKQERRSSGWV